MTRSKKRDRELKSEGEDTQRLEVFVVEADTDEGSWKCFDERSLAGEGRGARAELRLLPNPRQPRYTLQGCQVRTFADVPERGSFWGTQLVTGPVATSEMPFVPPREARGLDGRKLFCAGEPQIWCLDILNKFGRPRFNAILLTHRWWRKRLLYLCSVMTGKDACESREIFEFSKVERKKTPSRFPT